MATDTKAKFSTVVYITLTQGAPEQYSSQIAPVSTSRVLAGQTYGQISPMSGIDFTAGFAFRTNVSGIGDIVYYGPEASLIMNSGEISGEVGDYVEVSGLMHTSASYDSLTAAKSNAIIFAVDSGVATLPEPGAGTIGVYYYFANPLGLDFSVSGNSIRSSLGPQSVVALTGVGSHLGVVCDGGKWIATEERGIG